MTPKIPPPLAALQRYDFNTVEGMDWSDTIGELTPSPEGEWLKVADVEKALAAWPTQAQGWQEGYAEALADVHRHIQALALSNGFGTDSDAYMVDEMIQSMPVQEFPVHPSPSTASDDPNTCVLCKCRLPDAALREALRLIGKDGCTNSTLENGCMRDPGRTPDAPYTADKWCDACIANHALDESEHARTLLAGDNRGESTLHLLRQ